MERDPLREGEPADTRASDVLVERIRRLDVTLFDHVEAQLGEDDKRSLLALHAACRAAFGSFSYLEIGSHLGGSLQVVLRDPACTSVVSLDPRPQSQPDERGIRYRYPGNSTEEMLERLAAVPGIDLAKLHTIEAGTDELRPDELPGRPHLALVDGEHTDAAAFRDARFCHAAVGARGCIAFHDAPVVYRGIADFVQGLESAGQPFHAFLLPGSFFVVELGDAELATSEPVARAAREGYTVLLRALAETERYRAEYRRPAHRVLRRLERAASDAAQLLRVRRRPTGR